MPSSSESDRPLRIDAHVHTFNASDLSVRGFLTKVFLNADEKKIRQLAEPLVRLLDRLAADAPSAEDEEARIRWLLDRDGDIRTEHLARELAAEADTAAATVQERVETAYEAFGPDELDDAGFFTVLQEEIDRLKASTEMEDVRLYNALAKEVSFRRMVEPGATGNGSERESDGAFPFAPTLESRVPMSMATGTQFGEGSISRYIRWIRLLLRYRYKITRKLLHEYGQPREDAPTIDLFVPAIVDYARWLRDAPETGLPEQIDLMELNILLHEGRLLPFVAFDPWREAAHPDDPKGSLYWVKQAVTTQGFVGVKLYPPMGFAPIGNPDLDFSALGFEGAEAQRRFGRRLDDALRRLYAWCEAESVPILAHCSDSQEVKDGYGLRASPVGWRSVLEQYPDLRLNLGHFGGHTGLKGSPSDPDVEKGHGWGWVIGELMSTYDHVYADTGHFFEIRSPAFRDTLVDRLETFFDRHPVGTERLLYASDWLMLAKERGARRYLERFNRLYRSAFGDSAADKFFGANAMRYLGIDAPDQRTYERLLSFYRDRHDVDPPPWMQGVLSPAIAGDPTPGDGRVDE